MPATVISSADGVGGRPADGDAPLLELRGVGKRYGGVVALDEVSLTLAPGEVLGLIGPNGAGKTTLFDIISGITPPSSGVVRFGGADVTRATATARARSGVRRTFQRAQVFGWLTVADNVVSAVEWRGGGGGIVADLVAAPSRVRVERERRARADEVIAWCGLSELADRVAGALPLGQQRLVELARAVVDRPRLLLLDEPTSGLSHVEAELFGELIASLRGEGCGVVLVEHDVAFVMKHCGRVTVLNLGSVLAAGSPAEIQADPAVRAAYLG